MSILLWYVLPLCVMGSYATFFVIRRRNEGEDTTLAQILAMAFWVVVPFANIVGIVLAIYDEIKIDTNKVVVRGRRH